MLQTSDGLELTLTYYRGTKGKQTIPVVLLHGWKQSRNDYKDLAPALQAQGYAVIVPDLRGHGESTHLKGVRGDENLKAATHAARAIRGDGDPRHGRRSRSSSGSGTMPAS